MPSAERMDANGVMALLNRLDERSVECHASSGGGRDDRERAVRATALGVPAGTVRYRLSLARRTLAAALASYDHPATREPR